MKNQARVRLKPLGTLDAVVAAQAGQVLGGFRLLVKLQMPGRQEVGLDLVDVAVGMLVDLVQNLIWSVQLGLPSPPPGLRLGALCKDAHDVVWRSGRLKVFTFLMARETSMLETVSMSLEMPVQ